MIDSKLKFFSPIHFNYKLNVLQLLLLTFYTSVIFINNNLTHHFMMLVLIKLLDWVSCFKEIMDNNDYKKWLDFKNSNFFEKVSLSKYVFYITSLIYISTCLMVIFKDTSTTFTKFSELFIIIIIMSFNVIYTQTSKNLN